MPLLQELGELQPDLDNCEAILRFLEGLPIIGCGARRRLAALAAQRYDLRQRLEECLRKKENEREREREIQDDLRLPVPIDLPDPDEDDCPVDLVTWLCLPDEELPSDEPPCEPTPLGQDPDSSQIDPFPNVPDADEAIQFCRFIDNKIADAQGHDVKLPINTLAAYTRILAALAMRPNPPPGIVYKRCTEDALSRLTEYFASDLAPPEAETLLPLVETAERDLQEYFHEEQTELEAHVEDIRSLFTAIDVWSLSRPEAAALLPELQDLLATAISLNDTETTQTLTDLIAQAAALALESPIDPNRPTPPELLRPLPGTQLDPDQLHEQEDRFEVYLLTRAADLHALTLQESLFLEAQIQTRTDDYRDQLIEDGVPDLLARQLADDEQARGRFGTLPHQAQAIIDQAHIP